MTSFDPVITMIFLAVLIEGIAIGLMVGSRYAHWLRNDMIRKSDCIRCSQSDSKRIG